MLYLEARVEAEKEELDKEYQTQISELVATQIKRDIGDLKDELTQKVEDQRMQLDDLKKKLDELRKADSGLQAAQSQTK